MPGTDTFQCMLYTLVFTYWHSGYIIISKVRPDLWILKQILWYDPVRGWLFYTKHHILPERCKANIFSHRISQVVCSNLSLQFANKMWLKRSGVKRFATHLLRPYVNDYDKIIEARTLNKSMLLFEVIRGRKQQCFSVLGYSALQSFWV